MLLLLLLLGGLEPQQIVIELVEAALPEPALSGEPVLERAESLGGEFVGADAAVLL
jgi:hypothetical protein